MYSNAPEPLGTSAENIAIENIEARIYAPGDLADIVEVTYAYLPGTAPAETPNSTTFLGSGIAVNKTLFMDFIGLEQLPADLRVAGNLTLEKLIRRIADVDQSIQELLAIPHLSDRGQIMLGALEATRNILDMTRLGLPFELEKAGIPHELSSETVSDIVRKIEDLDVEIFGGRVSENPNETFRSLRTLFHAMVSDRLKAEAGKPSLTESEYTSFRDILLELCSKTGVDMGQLTTIETKNTDRPLPSAKREIPQSKYVDAFRHALDFYGIDIPIIVEARSSIYDASDALRIPESRTSITVEGVLALIAHEIESHYINQKNSEMSLGKVRGEKNLYKEEGMAVLSEHLLEGSKMEDLDTETGTLPDILAGELLSAETYRHYYLLKRKLTNPSNPVEMTAAASGIFLRRKRNYPLDHPGVQHKDTSYNRGLIQTIEFIQSGGNVRDLYVGKVGFADLEAAKQLSEQHGVQMTFPLLLAELVRYAMSGEKVEHADFTEHVQQKYPFIAGHTPVERLTFSQKRKVAGIIKILGGRKE